MSGHETPSGVGGDAPRQPMERLAHPSHGDPGPLKRMTYYVKDPEIPTARLSDTEPTDASAGTITASNPNEPGRTFGPEAALEYHGTVPSASQPQMGALPAPPLPLPSTHRTPEWYSHSIPPRQDEPLYQSTSTSTQRTPLPDTSRATVGTHQAGLPAPSSIQGRGYPVDSPWGGARDPSLVGNYPQYAVPVTRKEALEAAAGIGGGNADRSIPPGRAGVFPGHPQLADGRLAYDGAPYGHHGPMAPSPGDGYQGGPGPRPYVEREGRPDAGVPIHGNNPQQLITSRHAIDPKPQVDLSSPSLALRNSPYPQGAQYHVLDSVPPGHYVPGNTAMPAPGGVQGMTIYPNGVQAHGPPGQLGVPVEPAHPHGTGESPHVPMHHFSGESPPTGQGSNPQGFEAGYGYSFPPNCAPQFGLRTTPQYSMADLTPQSSLSPQSNMPPPSFTYRPPSQNPGTPDPPHEQQALAKGYVGKHEDVRQGTLDTRLSEVPHIEASSSKRGPESDAGDEPASRSKNQKKQRSAFSAEARQETSATRKTGACIRCRIQRARCNPDPNDPRGECETCRRVAKDSKKVIHRLPCLRWKITEITVSRTDDARGALGLTRRWQGFKLKDVGDWVSPETRVIQLSLGVCSNPITIEVRKFVPREGDVTFRTWRDGNVSKVAEIEPYALASVRESARSFSEYLYDNAVKGMQARAEDELMDGTVRETYLWAIRHYNALRVPELDESQQREEWLFLRDVFRLWMAVRHTMGSSHICGDEKLGMGPKVDDKTYPLWGRVSTPRMIIAQIDSINAIEVIPPLKRKVLNTLASLISANKTQYWFTIYIAIFLLLHNVSTISADRRRHGRANGAMKGYSLPAFVEDLQEGGNILLAYWHYYRTDEDPLEVDCTGRHRSRLVDLGAEQFSFVTQSCRVLRQKREAFRIQPNWDDEYYWVSRMFDKEWSPSESFRS